ncbi:MATE family efflux transporter [Nonomuraea gerenzanensis]|uniref:MATE family efflux transporter n=1 Tax=Nonomuraea gerenzanensis TaxID=93944 RepID=UPI001CDA0FAA|nr:MATE family efflux transporter [Nonomuraea gerenzanensis]UBU11910.1 polysaccharide biosynthesis C-terminal domain-containing protein [Nonomuraea gerenzanensis]
MIRLALPIYVELLTAVVAVGVIDLLWVSGLGEAAIAAVTVGTTAEYLAYGLFLAVPTGVTVLVGRRDGRAPLGPVIRTGWVLWAVFSVGVAVPGVLLREPLAALFTDSPALTADFFLISLGGLPVYFAQTVVDGVLKGLGDTKRPMRHAIICNVLVVVLDPLFIYGLEMGVQGAAVATVIARGVTLAIALRTVTRLREAANGGPAASEPAALGRGTSEPGGSGQAGRGTGGGGRAMAGEVIRTGLPMSGDFLARALVGMALVEIVAGFGTTAVAGYGVGQKVMLAGVMVFYALRQAAMIRTARSEPVRSPLVLGLGSGAVVAVALNVVAVPVAGLFAGDPAVAVEFMRWMALYLVPFGGLIAVGGVLQASGRGNRLLAATLAGFAVQLPLAYVLSAWLGLTGVWLSMATGAAVSLAGTSARLRPPAAPTRPSPDLSPSAAPTRPSPDLSPSAAPEPRAGDPEHAPAPAPRSTRTAADPPSGR